MKQRPISPLIYILFILLIVTTDCYAKEDSENRDLFDIAIPNEILMDCIEEEATKKGWKYAKDVNSLSCARMVNTNGIDGIGVFGNIRSINFSGGKIEDLSPLGHIISIDSLILSSNAISDLGPLSALTSLKTLNLGNNNISDINPLSALTGIEVLELYSNNISDISVLANLKNLKILSLYDNKITDISALYGLKNLVLLDLAGNSDLSVVQINELKKHLPGINLRLPFQVMDQTSEVGLNLEFKAKPMEVWDFLVPDLDLNQLIETYDRYNNLEDQKKAIIRTGEIKDFEGLEILSGLSGLEISHSELEHTYALRGLTKLKKVKLNDNRITNIEGLFNLKHLTSIECSANGISDITPLKNLRNLEHLSLSNNKISDISTLAGLKNLKRLFLGQNQIKDINPLLELPNIKIIELSQNEQIKCSDLERLKKRLPDTRIIFPKNCAHEDIQAVRTKFVNDLESLKIYRQKRTVKKECYSEDDGQLYRTTFTNGVKNREPVDVLGALPSWQKKVLFFTEIIGAKGRTITHRWYYNGEHQADVPFSINGDRWRTWSSKNIGENTSGVWQVKVTAENGCLLGHESIRISDSIVVLNKDSGGWFKPRDAITVLIKKGDTRSVLRLCDRNTIERRSADGDTPLMEAINAGEAKMVKGLLEKGANVFARDLSGKSTLDLAVSTKNRELVELIRKAQKSSPPWAVSRAVVTTKIENKEPQNCVLSGVGPSAKEVFLFTELMDMKGRTVVHRWMIDNKIILSSTSFKIKKDIERCHSTFKIKPALLNKRVRVNVVDEDGKKLFDTSFTVYDTDKSARMMPIDGKEIDTSAIYTLFKAAGSIQKIKYLVDKAKKNNYWGMLAKRKSLQKAIIHSRSITHLRYYLNQGADMDCRTALNMALKAGYDPMALYIKKRCSALERSNPAKVKKRGTNPILLALINNNGYMVRALLRLGEDPNYTFGKNANVLTRAVVTENIDIGIIHDLLAYGANPNSISTDTNKDTALMLAVKHCKLEIMKLLLAYGADPFMKNKDGVNSMDLFDKCPDSQQKKVFVDYIKSK